VAGRDFKWSDVYEYRPVVLVSESLAHELWDEPMAALGKRIRGVTASDAWREVVGVVGDVYDDGVHKPATPMVYWPMLLERAFGNERFVQRAVTFTIRTNRTATAHLLRPLQEAIWTVNPGVPVTRVRTLQDL
jgi:putative ABC transport system permease protein